MNKKIYFGAMALALLFSACSSDDILPDDNKSTIADVDQTLYVSMTISGDVVGSRGSEDNGSPNDDTTDFATGSENNVNNAYFVFYDDNGNVVGEIVPVELNDGNKEANVTGATVATSYKSVVSVSVRKGEKIPSQVICYINPISPGTLNVNLNTIQTVTRTRPFTDNEEETYFAMSNSVYYPAGEVPDSKPQIAVNIEGKLFKTQNEATNATEAQTAVIYVERYASKLAFNAVAPTEYKTATRSYDPDGNYTAVPVTLNFTPQFWAVNAQSNRTYVIKSFRQESNDGILLGDNFQYSELNNYINPTWNSGTDEWNYDSQLSENKAWDWNNPGYHRSYWGMSPAYFTAEYPEVSSDVTDLNENLNQTYLKYNELATKGFSADNTDPQYFNETTVGRIALKGKNPAAAVASVIYVGQYGVNVNGTDYSGVGFYTYLTGKVTVGEEVVDRPYIYFENNTNSTASTIENGESMLKRFLAQTTILYKAEVDDDNTVTGYTRYSITSDDDLEKLGISMKVDKINNSMRIKYDGDNNTKLKVQANACTLQFKDANAANGIYVLTGNGYQQVVADNATVGNGQITLTDANIALMRQSGMAYYYTSGHAYFNIPVKHLGWYRKGNPNRYKSDPTTHVTTDELLDKETLDWSLVRVGDFGMVRNHSYSIDVTEIKGLASGIGGDTDPIVPPATTDDYFMTYSVKILKWAVVPTQSVKL